MAHLVFFGANEIVLEVGRWAVTQERSVLLYTSPGQAGKGELAASAEAAGIAVITDERASAARLRDAVDVAESTFISVGAPWIFSAAFLNELGAAVLNLHGTRLPRDRGGTVFSWQILSGLRTGMCLLHELTPGIDDGPIVAYEEFIYPAECRKPVDYIRVYNERNVEFLKSYLEAPERESTRYLQPPYLSTYWPRLRADVNGWVDWSNTVGELERFICAFDEPYGGARTQHRGRTVVLRDVYAQRAEPSYHPFQTGIVLRNNKRWLTVAVSGGELLVCSVQGIDGSDLLPTIRPGDRLYTGADQLSDARHRVVKTAAGLTRQTDLT